MKKYDLAAVTGKYQKDGKEKSRYKNVGTIMDKGNGPFILFDRTFNPAGLPGDGDMVIISMFTPKDSNVHDGDMDDSVPW